MRKKLYEKKIKDGFFKLFKKSEQNVKWKVDIKNLDKRLKVLNGRNKAHII